MIFKFQLKEKADSVQIGIPGVKKGELSIKVTSYYHLSYLTFYSNLGISGGQMRRLSFASEVNLIYQIKLYIKK